MLAFDRYERQQWSGRASAYDQTLASLCSHPGPALIDAVEIAPGARVLDVGTGSGTVAGLARERGADVTAVDAEPSMVALARHRAPDLDVREGALPDLPFDDDSFDVAIANFVINHVGDPAAAIRGMRRVVHPGGRVAVTIWPYPPPPLQGLLAEALAAAGAPRPPIPRLDNDLDFPRTVDGLAGLLRGAGLTDVACTELTWHHRVDPENWWSGPASGIGAMGFVITSQTPEMIKAIKREYGRLIAPHITSDGLLSMPTAAVLGSGLA
jgi:SAM-dependent methyltransferase